MAFGAVGVGEFGCRPYTVPVTVQALAAYGRDQLRAILGSNGSLHARNHERCAENCLGPRRTGLRGTGRGRPGSVSATRSPCPWPSSSKERSADAPGSSSVWLPSWRSSTDSEARPSAVEKSPSAIRAGPACEHRRSGACLMCAHVQRTKAAAARGRGHRHPPAGPARRSRAPPLENSAGSPGRERHSVLVSSRQPRRSQHARWHAPDRCRPVVIARPLRGLVRRRPGAPRGRGRGVARSRCHARGAGARRRGDDESSSRSPRATA